MNKSRVIMVGAVVLIFVLLALPGLKISSPDSNRERSLVELKPPSFINAASASGSDLASFIGDKLDEEAGISAYYQAPGPIDLGLAKTAFRVLELETVDYLIGSVDVPDYPEHYDAHVYVHKDGWLLAYYLRPDPPSKIIDVRGQTIQSSLLESALAVVAGAAGVPFSSATHYDFRYPNATHMLLVAEGYSDGNTFEITLPGEYGYYDRSYGFYIEGGLDNFRVDDTVMSNTFADNNYHAAYGTISASQLLPDVPHSVSVYPCCNGYGVLMLIYGVP
jgi:hypothetical protein